MRAPATVTLDSQALATLRYIRASMEAAGTVPVPGSAGAAVGIIGLAAATLSATDALRPWWIEVWLLAAVAGATTGALFVAQRNPDPGFALLGAAVRRVYRSLLPCLFAGAVLTIVFWHGGNLRAIPGTWLLLYGCALMYASPVTSRAIGLLGGAFVLLSLVAFLVPDTDPARTAVLGIGFGELHVLYAVVVRRTTFGEGRETPATD